MTMQWLQTIEEEDEPEEEEEEEDVVMKGTEPPNISALPLARTRTVSDYRSRPTGIPRLSVLLARERTRR